MDDKDYYDLISKQIDSLDAKLTRLFKKGDEMQKMLTKHDVKINLIYGFSITAMTGILGFVGKFMFDFFSSLGGTP